MIWTRKNRVGAVVLFCAAAACSGDGGGSAEATGSTSSAVGFCDDLPLSYDLAAASGSTTANEPGTFNGYIPTAITASPSAAGFTAAVSLTVNSIVYPFAPVTCNYAYTASGGQFINPTNTCVPPPLGACFYGDCPDLPEGYRFSGATGVSMTITRGTGSGELTGSGDFGDAPVDDGNPCTTDACVGTSASHVALAAGSSCSDNNICNGTETCNAAASCVSSGNAPTGTSCADSNVCNGVEACNGSGVCVSPGNAPNGTPCPDSHLCDGTETCTSGSCVSGSGTPLTVPAATTCTTSACDDGLGIVTTTSTTGVCAASYQPTGSSTDSTVPTDFAGSTSFLYTAATPIQTGVSSGTIVPAHAAVIRGHVLDTNGSSALVGAVVTILNHPEFGQTLSRSDGAYDLAVNGGSGYVVDYQLSGRLPSQRSVTTTWLDYTNVDDVILVPIDTTSPFTATNGATTSQFSTGPSVMDDDGTRSANVYIPAQTFIQGYGGGTYTLHATEFTKGSDGPKMMPGSLPPQSAYTYAVDFSVDETSNVKFVASDGVTPQAVYVYVDDFVGIPVGTAVPAGYYDRVGAHWTGSPDGVVMILLDSSGDVNVTGTMSGGSYVIDSGATLSAIGMTNDEQAALAARYAPGTQLMRVPMTHFTGLDFNWAQVLPATAAPPPPTPPLPPLPPDDPCIGSGSIIECQSQILAEEIPIYGTPYSLRYQSDRVLGRKTEINIPISGSTLPPAVLQRVDVTIDVAGQHAALTAPPPTQPNQSVTWLWDGLDAYGREVQGNTRATIRVSYVYPNYYGKPASLASGSATSIRFAGYALSALSGHRAAGLPALDQKYVIDVGHFDATNLGFGGWSLSAEHVYDPRGILYRGDGRRQTGKALSPIVQTIAGSASGTLDAAGDGHPATSARLRSAQSVAVGPDGSFYIAEVNNHVVRKVDTNGTISHFAGIYNPGADVGTFTDGATPTTVPMQPFALAIGPDGNLYVAETNAGYRVLKITLGATPGVYLVAGNRDSTHNTSTFSGDGGLATSATLETPRTIAAGPDGSVYIGTGNRVRLITPDGLINTVAGNGTCNTPLTGQALGASPVALCSVNGLALGPDGALYIATTGGSGPHFRIRKMTADGVISIVAGNGIVPSSFSAVGDGSSALSSEIEPQEVHVSPDGDLYFANYVFSVAHRFFEGSSIQTFAGIGETGAAFSGDGGPATAAKFGQFYSFAFAPDGSMYIADQGNLRIRRIFFDDARTSTGLEVPSVDGDEIYQFDASGEHLATVSTARGQTRQQLTYTGRLLTSIADGDHNTTTITRPSGQVTIVGPFNSETTTLNLDSNGYLLSVVTPNGETYNMSHTSTGLLTSFKKPNWPTAATFTYGPDGRLVHDTDALTGSAGQSLAQSLSGLGYSVSHTTAQGLTKSYGMDFSVAPHPTTYPGSVVPVATQKEHRTFLSASGLQSTDQRLTDGSRLVGLADGTLTWTQFAPDPRFGAGMEYVSGRTIQKGSHTRTEATLKAATLSNANDLFSLTSETTTTCVNGTSPPTTCGGTGAEKTATTFTASTNTELTTLPSTRQIKRMFDPTDRVISTQRMGTSPVSLNAVQYGYDSNGRVHTVTVGSRVYETDYDATTGFVTQVKDNALGITTTNTAWDSDGRPTTTTLPGGYTLGRTYDADGNLASLTTPNTNAHYLISNAIDLLGEYDPPASGASTTYNYDFDHNLAALLDPDGTSVYLRDPGGRIFSTGEASFVYSSSTGLLTSEIAGTEARYYTYDGPLVSTIRVTSAGTPSYSNVLTLGRDIFFQTTSRQFTGLSSISYGYDLDGNLTTAGALTINRGSGSSTNGLVLTTTIGSLTETPTFDAWGALSSDVYGSVYSVSYTRDTGGRVTAKSETISGTTTVTNYVYDGGSGCPTTANDGRLCQVFSPPGTMIAQYTYDADGNRTDLSGSYDAQDRMTGFNGATYSYTPGGRLLKKTDGTGDTIYTYDVHDNLTDVTFPSAPEVKYVVDAQNRRVAKSIGGTAAQEFVYDDTGRIALELDGSGTPISQFVYGTKPNVPDYMINTISGVSTTYRLITDQLGSVRLVVNASTSAIVERIEYDAWGNILTGGTETSNGNAADVAFQPFGFAGGIQDRETGLVRFGARDYDPSTGRWTDKDPIRFAGGNDFYVYCNNDPINHIDPFGFQPFDPSFLQELEDGGEELWEGLAGSAAGAWLGDKLAGLFPSPSPAPTSPSPAPAGGVDVPSGAPPLCEPEPLRGRGPDKEGECKARADAAQAICLETNSPDICAEVWNRVFFTCMGLPYTPVPGSQ